MPLRCTHTFIVKGDKYQGGGGKYYFSDNSIFTSGERYKKLSLWVRPRERFLDPSLLSILYMTIIFSKLVHIFKVR